MIELQRPCTEEIRLQLCFSFLFHRVQTTRIRTDSYHLNVKIVSLQNRIPDDLLLHFHRNPMICYAKSKIFQKKIKERKNERKKDIYHKLLVSLSKCTRSFFFLLFSSERNEKKKNEREREYGVILCMTLRTSMQ